MKEKKEKEKLLLYWSSSAYKELHVVF